MSTTHLRLLHPVMVPYPPSWLDHVKVWLARLPGPSWLYYVANIVLFLVVGNLGRWLEGLVPWGTFAPDMLVPALWGPGLIGFSDYLDRFALTALPSLRPLLHLDDQQYNRLAYELVTIPPRRAWLASLVWLSIGIILWGTNVERVSTTFTLWEVALYIPTFFTTGAVIYHTLHQLRMVSRIYSQIQGLNIFQLEFLQALSGLTARTAAGWILLSYISLAVLPGSISLGGFGVTLLVAVALALLVFILPLLGIHQLLVHEKEEQLIAVNHRLEETIKQLYQCADSALDDVAASRAGTLNKLLTSLMTTRTFIAQTSTWPWQPGTIQAVGTTILLPIALWLIQFFLQRFLEG